MNTESEAFMLLWRVERFIRRFDIPPTRFGSVVVNDPRFVFDLRRGREPRPKTVERVEAYLRDAERWADPC